MSFLVTLEGRSMTSAFEGSPTTAITASVPLETSKLSAEVAADEPMVCLSPRVIIHSSLFSVRLSWRDKCCRGAALTDAGRETACEPALSHRPYPFTGNARVSD